MNHHSVMSVRWLAAVLCILFAQSSSYAADFVFAADDISVVGPTGGHQYYVKWYIVRLVNQMYVATPSGNPVDYIQVSAVDVMPGMKKYTYRFSGGTVTPNDTTVTNVYGKVYLKSTTGGADTYIKDLDPTP